MQNVAFFWKERLPNPDINTVGGIVGAVVENADNVGLGLLPGKPTGTSSGGGGDDEKKPDGSGKPAATTDSSLLATVGETKPGIFYMICVWVILLHDYVMQAV